jgi:hypothetical protein
MNNRAVPRWLKALLHLNRANPGSSTTERQAWVVELFTIDPIDGYLEHWGAVTQPFECREDADRLVQQRIQSTGLDQSRYRVNW